MTAKFSPKQIQNLKNRAKKIKSASGVTHYQALDQIAVENGFKNWAMLAKFSAETNDEPVNHTSDEGNPPSN